ncbi:MAG TPA: hypothetical protein VII41_14100, partial [Steroidobacteraceae bacterium]
QRRRRPSSPSVESPCSGTIESMREKPMLAAVYYRREDLRLEAVPEPEPGAGEVKLRVHYNGICASLGGRCAASGILFGMQNSV